MGANLKFPGSNQSAVLGIEKKPTGNLRMILVLSLILSLSLSLPLSLSLCLSLSHLHSRTHTHKFTIAHENSWYFSEAAARILA